MYMHKAGNPCEPMRQNQIVRKAMDYAKQIMQHTQYGYTDVCAILGVHFHCPKHNMHTWISGFLVAIHQMTNHTHCLHSHHHCQ